MFADYDAKRRRVSEIVDLAGISRTKRQKKYSPLLMKTAILWGESDDEADCRNTGRESSGDDSLDGSSFHDALISSPTHVSPVFLGSRFGELKDR